MNNVFIVLSVLISVINTFNLNQQRHLPLRADCTVTNFDYIANATLSCQDIIISDLFIPGGNTLVLDLQDGATVTFKGNNTFGYWNWTGPLIIIHGNEIIVQGEEGHVLNGLGEQYWDGLGSSGVTKPKFMTIEANGSLFKNLNFYHAPIHAITVNNSHNVVLTDFVIDNAAGAVGVAPAGHEGHNTDGFDVKMSTNITIKDSKVYNQDDCVALNSGSDIHVANLLCYGSHGLSLSVGFSNDSIKENTLSNILIENSIIIGAMDGIHIKTHINAGIGLISNITYRNIFMIGTKRNVSRKRWVKDWITKKERYGHMKLLKEIVSSDVFDYCNYFQMDRCRFDTLVTMVEPYLKRQNTTMREALSVKEKLAVTLRYLATGSYSNGIAIEQNYTNSPTNEKTGAMPLDNIPIKGLRFYNIQGTVLNTSVPYYIVCAKSACEDWEWENVMITGQQDSACVNFHPDGIECVDYTV